MRKTHIYGHYNIKNVQALESIQTQKYGSPVYLNLSLQCM